MDLIKNQGSISFYYETWDVKKHHEQKLLLRNQKWSVMFMRKSDIINRITNLTYDEYLERKYMVLLGFHFDVHYM